MDETARQRQEAEVNGRREDPTVNPEFAAGGNLSTAKLAVQRVRDFRHRYAEALKTYKTGDISLTVFPYGTWKMVRFHHCPCEPPPQV